MYFNPDQNLVAITEIPQKRAIQSIMETIDSTFGFKYIVDSGNIIEVQLVSSGLAIIPRQLKELPQLAKLQVPSNRIQKLRNVERLSSLKILNMSDNKIDDESLTNQNEWPNLIALDLSYNQITDANALRKISTLERLNLKGNLLDVIPKGPFPHLKAIDLRENPIRKLEHLHKYSSLEQLLISEEYLSAKEQEIVSQGIEIVQKYCKSRD